MHDAEALRQVVGDAHGEFVVHGDAGEHDSQRDGGVRNRGIWINLLRGWSTPECH